ncbi:MAG: Stealth CR1 domain-containing protein [Bacteroidales bacterium]|nr:Stealth CR1 domain-containing protein [Bacteroidales bacterium]
MIDAVLTWVDGNDPALKAVKTSYLTGRKEDTLNDVAGPARYIQEGELHYAIASILRFAEYVKRIFIVTPGQDPHLEDFIGRNFPDSKVPVIIIDQDSLFEGHEKYLPVFNSIAVETMIWRIPGLSEEFIYMNDDFFFAAPSRYEDLFQDGKVVLYSERYPNIAAEFLRLVRPRRKDGKRRFTYKDSLLNSSYAAGMNHYYHLPHEPHPLLKSLFEDFYREHPEAITRNISHRFRDNEQYNVQSLGYLLAEKAGKLIHRSASGLTIKFQPAPEKKNHIQKKLKKISRMKNLRYGCMNDLRNASEDEKKMFWEYMSNLLDVKFKQQ